MKAQNEKEFLALIERYESITEEEIERKIKNNYYVPPFGADIKKDLTGFGSSSSCPLCVATTINCIFCVYKENYGCKRNENKKTYHDLFYAETAKQLLKALKARAKHMKKVYKEYLEKNN